MVNYSEIKNDLDIRQIKMSRQINRLIRSSLNVIVDKVLQKLNTHNVSKLDENLEF